MLHMEGSVLVFEDIFKLIAFYCVSRDILPFPLTLPQAFLEAKSYQDLETISNLGKNFWSSSLNQRKNSENAESLNERHTNSAHSGMITANEDFSSNSVNQCSCEIELSVGSDRLWFVNPIFIEECSNILPPVNTSLQKHSLKPGQSLPATRHLRPAPAPPNRSTSLGKTWNNSMSTLYEGELEPESLVSAYEKMKLCSLDVRKPKPVSEQGKCNLPVPPLHVLSPISSKSQTNITHEEQEPSDSNKACEICKQLTSENLEGEIICSVGQCGHNSEDKETKELCKENTCCITARECLVKASTCLTINKAQQSLLMPTSKTERSQKDHNKPPRKVKPSGPPPIPPPRTKKMSKQQCTATSPEASASLMEDNAENKRNSSQALVSENSQPVSLSASSESSLCSQEGNSLPLIQEHDSYSTSSTEDDLEPTPSRKIKTRLHSSSSLILDKAKNRLSIAAITNVFTVLLSADRKVHKKILELAQDKETYFGNLVQYYKSYTLENMERHTSSLELLQEIRLTMTQLKNYLIQSTELKTLTESLAYPEDKLEALLEASLCKCVLRPLRNAIYSCLKTIHSKDGSFSQLTENQTVVQKSTTTELGVTTCVPEVPVMEKIKQKFTYMHKAYSPEKKIATLLKTCKLIYESMSLGNPGRSFGADDFLPVLMYVLAQSDLTSLFMDVEYMMELMDPSLQLGEGSYYLTTTYGAVEHIRNYDKLPVTRQLSMDVQDSIHRWERRRTLNKAHVSKSSVQDFITISLLEANANSKTVAIHPEMTVQDLCQYCAEKFEAEDLETYALYVYVEEKCIPLASDARPLNIKSSLLKTEPRKEYSFVFKPVDIKDPALPVKELDLL
ncbi:ras and Rab interactor 3 isoform X2 [Protopterus annectens]|nr:ras and Rab interactor 3 isoform X2 [Protopterus annectens]